MAASTILTRMPEKGLARVCPSGCVHLTYGLVTLHFRQPGDFERLAVAVRERQEGGPPGPVHVRYCHATLHFSEAEFEGFARLVQDAARELDRLEVVRLLLTDPRSR